MYVCMYVYIDLYICIYIYIERERYTHVYSSCGGGGRLPRADGEQADELAHLVGN